MPLLAESSVPGSGWNILSPGFHASTTASLVRAAGDAQKALATRFGNADPASWRDPRKLYDVQVQGVATAPKLKFYDRGTFSQAVELGP